MKISIDQVESYITKDGSLVRELIRPQKDERAHVSLAEATVVPGAQTRMHIHEKSQEIYHITQGSGVMILGTEDFCIGEGDSILIPAGTRHSVRSTGLEPLKILCFCSPAYTHEDTVLLEPDS